jgi:hypothetical protein
MVRDRDALRQSHSSPRFGSGLPPIGAGIGRNEGIEYSFLPLNILICVCVCVCVCVGCAFVSQHTGFLGAALNLYFLF